MKKKIILTVVGLFFAAAAVWGGITLYNQNKMRIITDFYDNNPDTITKMTIMSGSNGNTVEVPKQYYQQVTNALAALEFPGVYKGPHMDGWSYRLIVEDDKDGVDIVPSGNRCDIHDKGAYNLNGHDILVFLEELYTQLYQEEKAS